ncbi:hypothetical protein D3C87_2031220 [compost metagenome]
MTLAAGKWFDTGEECCPGTGACGTADGDDLSFGNTCQRLEIKRIAGEWPFDQYRAFLPDER